MAARPSDAAQDFCRQLDGPAGPLRFSLFLEASLPSDKLFVNAGSLTANASVEGLESIFEYDPRQPGR